MTEGQTRYTELVGLFHSADALERAIAELSSSGWDHAELSLLAQHDVLAPPHVERKTAELADDPEAERQAPLSDSDVRQVRTLVTGMTGVVAAFMAGGATILTGGGAFAAVVGAAVAGGGAGALVEALGQRVASDHNRFLREQVEQGGILLWVKISSTEKERRARQIFTDCGADHVHLHESV